MTDENTSIVVPIVVTVIIVSVLSIGIFVFLNKGENQSQTEGNILDSLLMIPNKDTDNIYGEMEENTWAGGSTTNSADLGNIMN